MMRKIFVSCMIMSIMSTGLLFSQSTAGGGKDLFDMKLKFVTPMDFQRWTVLDNFDFDKVNNWNLSTSDSKSENQYVVIPTYKKVSPGVDFSAIEGGRFLAKTFDNNPSCLGIKINYPEMNKVDVFIWPKEGYKLTGVCKKISVWLLGRGYDADIQIIVKDYLNKMYYIPVTKLDYVGWKHFEIEVPSDIPQSASPFPQKETLSFEGFLVTNNPSRYADVIVKPLYLYIDQLEVMLDHYYEVYTGLEITDDW